MFKPELQIFDHASTDNQHIGARDLFALGCYLDKQGKTSAGSKARWAALQAIGVPLNEISAVVNAVQNDRAWIASKVAPHSEILALFDD